MPAGILQGRSGARASLHCCGALTFASRTRRCPMTIRVAVVDENEIFRLGVVACLDDKATFHVTSASAHAPTGPEAAAVSKGSDVGVVSAKAVRESELRAYTCNCGWTSRTVPTADVGAELQRWSTTGEHWVPYPARRASTRSSP